jgi:hypothetical protein
MIATQLELSEETLMELSGTIETQAATTYGGTCDSSCSYTSTCPSACTIGCTSCCTLFSSGCH